MQVFKYISSMKFVLLLALVAQTLLCQSQVSNFEVNGHHFVTKTITQPNEWESTDTLCKIYRIEDNTEVHVLDYYLFKDGGGDCNNLFWDREYIQFQADSVIFRTAYFQKTNMDPIPTERKQIYLVDSNGKLKLVFDKYRYRNDRTWVDQ